MLILASHLHSTKWKVTRIWFIGLLQASFQFVYLAPNHEVEIGVFTGCPSELAWLIYKYAMLWSAVYGPSTTEDSLELFLKRRKFLWVPVYFLVLICPKLLKAT